MGARVIRDNNEDTRAKNGTRESCRRQPRLKRRDHRSHVGVAVEEPRNRTRTVDVLDNNSRGVLVELITRLFAYRRRERDTPEDNEGGGA